jgi:hypothetical protein
VLFSHKPQIPGAKITRLSDPEFAMIIAHHWWPESITPRWGPNVQLSCEAKIGITIGEGLRVVACSNIFIYVQLIQGTHDPRSTHGKISDRTANRVTFKLPRTHNRQSTTKSNHISWLLHPCFVSPRTRTYLAVQLTYDYGLEFATHNGICTILYLRCKIFFGIRYTQGQHTKQPRIIME